MHHLTGWLEVGYSKLACLSCLPELARRRNHLRCASTGVRGVTVWALEPSSRIGGQRWNWASPFPQTYCSVRGNFYVNCTIPSTHILHKQNFRPKTTKNQTTSGFGGQLDPFDIPYDTTSSVDTVSNKDWDNFISTTYRLIYIYRCSMLQKEKTNCQLNSKPKVSQTGMLLKGISSSSLKSFCEEGMTQCFLCCMSVCWIILQQPLQKVNQITGRLIHILHHQILLMCEILS